MTVKDRDLGFRALLQRLGKLQGMYVTVGIHEDKGSDAHKGEGGLTVADVGAFHEIIETMNRRLPQRSWLRGTIDEQEKEIKAFIKRAAMAIVSNNKRLSPHKAFGLVGLEIERRIKKRIIEGIPPPLAESTKERKRTAGRGKETPLIFSGQFLASIASKVHG